MSIIGGIWVDSEFLGTFWDSSITFSVYKSLYFDTNKEGAKYLLFVSLHMAKNILVGKYDTRDDLLQAYSSITFSEAKELLGYPGN